LDSESPDLAALRQRLAEEEAAYAEVLGAVDALADFRLPLETHPELSDLLARLNQLWETAPPPSGGGLAGRRQRALWSALAPLRERQQQFNSVLVQLLNAYLDDAGHVHARLRNLAAALVRYLQRVLPVMDARDRMATALATTRSELVLEAFDRRQESLARRLSGLLALRDRVETLSEQQQAVQHALKAAPPTATAAAAAVEASDSAAYSAFENRFRGDREEIRERMRSYLPLFAALAPVVDLGCGRGEFLELLREAGVAARGVEASARAVQECRDRGLEVVQGDLLQFMRQQHDAALGGVFAAQVAEHLPPPVLTDLLGQAHRTLRSGGLLVLETVNPRSLVGFLEVFNRDLTHERPLHPDTLSFLAAAAGFSDVRVELRSPVDPAARLQPVPAAGLPAATTAVINENVERLNAMLYGPQEYALLARR